METAVTEKVQRLLANIEQIVLGKHDVVKMCVVGLLARGHVLIEDVPGIGKTTLAQSLARSLDCSFHRIQFTSDMLPSDILGVSILDPKTNNFEFRPGPIFAHVILADEVNRTSPKTQSALLEAMSENQVSVDGKTHLLYQPFLVLATQNPIEYEGTYTLPESQLDRFMLRVEVGYPPAADELRIMRRRDSQKAIANLKPALSIEEILALQDRVGEIIVDESVVEYMLAIVENTRRHDQILLGASPRGSQSLLAACQAWALLDGRDYVTPNDVKHMADAVLGHRLLIKSRGMDLAAAAKERSRILAEIIRDIEIPA